MTQKPYIVDELISAKAIAARVEALAKEISTFYADTDNQRNAYLWSAVGRLRPGATIDGARAEVDAILESIATTYGTDAGVSGGRVRRLFRRRYRGRNRSRLTFGLLAVLAAVVAEDQVSTGPLGRHAGGGPAQHPLEGPGEPRP